MLYSF